MSEYQEFQEFCDLKSKKEDFSDEKIDEILDDQFNSRIQQILKQPANLKQTQNFQAIYSSFFQGIEVGDHNIKEVIQNQDLIKKVRQSYFSILQQNGFIIMNQDQKVNKNANKLQIKLVFQTQFNDVVEILCQLGPFAKRYVILNEDKQSFRHQNKVIGLGSFGKLYSCHQQSDETQSVVKCINYDHNRLTHLKNTIKEFFICDIMSSLKIGPKILKRSGFDFILFSNCIEFEMQRCVPCELQSLEKDTKQNLFSMHILQIIHFDIKPVNIMYSKVFQKNVLLDYGISQWIHEPIGTKTLTKFRGTFEFCGQQMRKIFMKAQYEFIDLYLNDLNMLSNSIQYYRNYNVKQIQSTLPYRKLKKDNFSKSNIMFQQTLKLKYHLYLNQFDQKITEDFQLFLNKLNKFQPFKDLEKIVKQCLAYAQKLECNSLKNFSKHFISKNPKLKHFQIDIDSSLNFSYNYYWQKINNLLKRQQDNKFIQLYQNLQNDNQIENTKTCQQQNSANLQLMNIEYIFQNKNELQKLQIEQIFELYLTYCQFWKCKFQVKSKQKQKISLIFKDFVIKSSKQFQQINQKHKMIKQDFWMRLNFVYSSMVVYCQKGQFNDFKEKYMIAILKDCIILEIQYHKFIRDYVTYYFKCLIKKRSKKLITLIVVDFMQLIFLTNNHFLLTYYIQKNSYKDKYFFICSKQIIEDLIKQLAILYNIQDQYYQKVQVMKILWETLFNQQFAKHQEYINKEKFISNVIKIVQMIQKQFSDHKIKQIASLSSLSISYIYFTVKYINQIFNLSLSFQSNLLKHYDNEINKSWNFNLLQIKNLTDLKKVQVLLDLFDKKIDIPTLSQYFFVPLRFTIYNRNKSIEYIQQNFANILLRHLTHPSINYEIILQIFRQSFPYQIFEDQQMQDMFQGHLVLSYCQLLLFFFNQGQSKKLIQCLHSIKGKLYQYLSQINCQKIKVTLKHIIKLDQKKQHIFLLKIILLEYQNDYSVQYMLLKKQIFSLFLQMIKTGRQIMSYQNYYLEELCLCNLYLQDQILKLWQNIKLQFILNLDPLYYEYSHLLNLFFIQTKNFTNFFEIFWMLSKKKIFLTDTRAFVDILDNFNYYLQDLQINHSQSYQFYQFYQKNCKNEDKQTKIFFLLCVLRMNNFLKNNQQLWKKLLFKFYLDYSELKKKKKFMKLSLLQWIDSCIIYRMSIQKLQKKIIEKYCAYLDHFQGHNFHGHSNFNDANTKIFKIKQNKYLIFQEIIASKISSWKKFIQNIKITKKFVRIILMMIKMRIFFVITNQDITHFQNIIGTKIPQEIYK